MATGLSSTSSSSSNTDNIDKRTDALHEHDDDVPTVDALTTPATTHPALDARRRPYANFKSKKKKLPINKLTYRIWSRHSKFNNRITCNKHFLTSRILLSRSLKHLDLIVCSPDLHDRKTLNINNGKLNNSDTKDNNNNMVTLPMMSLI